MTTTRTTGYLGVPKSKIKAMLNKLGSRFCWEDTEIGVNSVGFGMNIICPDCPVVPLLAFLGPPK